MTRAERLLALVAELRAVAPEPVPARVLAARLAVSERTVQRDVMTLAHEGLPVTAHRGDGYAVAAEREPAAVTGTVSLTRPVRRTVTDAVRTRRVVRIAHTDETGERTRRDVDPHGLVVAAYGEYLVGWCRLRDGPRMFRLDRIDAARLTTRPATTRPLDELLTALRVPATRRPPDDEHGSPEQARTWALERLGRMRTRLDDTVAETRTAGGGAALHATLAHLAEWTRWQSAAVRAVTTGEDMAFTGRRPRFPDRFDETLDAPTREAMIQEAMAARSLAEVADDLGEVLDATADWLTGCDEGLWRELLPDPAQPGRRRRLADLLAGWYGPLDHIEWHLDRVGDDSVRRSRDGLRLVVRCPLAGPAAAERPERM